MSWGITPEQSKNILEFIYNNPYCGVIAPTGSGKSTTLIENMYKYEENSRIFISEPTIPAAEGLYQRMSGILGKDVVGFAAEGNIKYNNATSIIYCTSGHLRRKILNYFKNGEIPSGKIDFCTTIVLDEAHNGTLDIDCIIEMWKYAVEKGVIPPRLVLISATLSEGVSSFDKLPLYEIKTKSYPIKLEYIRKDYSPDNRMLYTDLAGNIAMKHIQLPVKEDESSKWLVFCAGSSEVEVVCSTLRGAGLENVTILPVYSTLTSEQINRIFEPVEPGFRSIIVSTNIAEASITIDGLDGVFDSMTEKVAETSSSGGFRLVVKNISKSSASQRKGRTGRTKPGFCFRMCTEKLYNSLPDQRDPEIMRVPLTTPAIEFLNVGLNPVKLFGDRVSGDRIKLTLSNLFDLGMIDDKNNVLEAGKFATRLPLAIQSTALIYHWTKLLNKDGNPYPLFPIVVLAVLIDSYGPSYYYYPKKDEFYDEDEHYNQYFKKYDSKNDLKTMLLMWNDMMKNLKTIKPSYESVLFFCQENSLNNKKIQEVIRVIRQCCLILSNNFDKRIDMGPFNEDLVLKVATPIMVSVYKKNIFTKTKDYVYLDSENNKYFRTDPKNMITRTGISNARQIIALQTAEIAGSGKGSNNIISLFYPL